MKHANNTEWINANSAANAFDYTVDDNIANQYVLLFLYDFYK